MISSRVRFLVSSVIILAGCGGRRVEVKGPLLQSEEPSPAVTIDLNAIDQARPATIQLKSEEVRPGGSISGTVELYNRYDSLRLLWVDQFDRVTAVLALTQRPPRKPGIATLDFKFPMPPESLGRKQKLALVSAMLPSKSRTPEFKVEAVVPFDVEQPAIAWNDYLILSPSDSRFPIHSVAPVADAIPHDHPLYLKNWEARVAAYAKSRDPLLLERQPPLFDEVMLNTARTAMAENLVTWRHPPAGWSLGDCSILTHSASPLDYDMSAPTLEIFRAWLEKRYGSLEKLNTQWGTTFAAWTDVRPQSAEDAKRAMNPAYGNPANAAGQQIPLHTAGAENFSAWSDFRAFNDFAFSRLLGEFRSHLRTLDPGALAGISNLHRPAAFGGWDYTLLARQVDWVEEHDCRVGRELLAGLAPQIRFATHITTRGELSRYRLWDRWLGGDDACKFKIPVLKPAEGSAEMPPDPLTADLQQMTSGLTLLRQRAQRRIDSIAIYYSPRSFHAHWMLDSEVDGAAWMNRVENPNAGDSALQQISAWWFLLNDLGYSPQFTSAQQLLSGNLKPPKLRVIILPKVVCLSDAEAAALRNFVRAGGYVIADGQCGVFDGYGKRRASGVLDEDFGLVRTGHAALELSGRFNGDEKSLVTLQDPNGATIGPVSNELRVLEPGIAPSGKKPIAKSKAGAAALLSKGLGKGRFFYLNLAMQDYPRLRAKTETNFQFAGMAPEEYAARFGEPTGGEALRVIAGDILTDISPPPAIKVQNEDGIAVRGIRRVLYSTNSADLIGLIPLAEETSEGLTGNIRAAQRIVASMERERHWYDLHSGEYLGFGKEAVVEIAPDRATIVSGLPYHVSRLNLRIRRTDLRGMFKVTAAIVADSGVSSDKNGRKVMPAEVAVAGQQVFHVEVRDPEGNLLPHYSRNVTAADGVWNGQITFGMNEPAGKYLVTVRDVASGRETRGELWKEQAEYSGLEFEKK